MSAQSQVTLTRWSWWSHETPSREYGPVGPNRTYCRAGCGDIIKANQLPSHLQLECEATDREVRY